LCELRDDVWPELDAAISRCLQREPDRRFQDVLELSQALELAIEAHDGPKPSGRGSELVTEPLPLPVQVPVSAGVVDWVAGTEANLDVSLELSQISGLRKRRWPQRLVWLTAFGAVFAGAWVAFSWENRHAPYYRRASMDLSSVAVSENSIARPPLAVPAAVLVQARQPVAADPARPTPRVSPRARKAKSVREYAVGFERTVVEPPAITDAAVERVWDGGTELDSPLFDDE